MDARIGIVFLLGIGMTYGAAVVDETHVAVISAVDASFEALDHNHNGIMELNEFEESYYRLDTNHDHMITESEYTAGSPDHQFSAAVFKQLDYDKKGYLERGDAYGQFSIMDTSGDNIVSRAEFDTYFVKLILAAAENHLTTAPTL